MRLRRKAAAAAGAALLVAALAATAIASGTTVGGLPAVVGITCGGSTDAVELGSASYVVPAGTWTVTSWSTRGAALSTASMRLVVYTDIGGGSYQVVAVSPTETSVAAVVNTFHTPLTVHGGNILGIWGVGDPGCAGTIGTGTGTFQFGITGGAPSIGTVITPGISFALTNADISMTLSNGSNVGSVSNSGTHEGYCMPKPVLREDGTTGTFISLDVGQGATDPAYAGAVPAVYGQGYGITCDNLTGLGYQDAGYKVDYSGSHNGTAADLYEYFTK